MNSRKKQRLSKFMAGAGIASRRTCEEIIFKGRVTVNGALVLLPQTLVDEEDTILLDKLPLPKTEDKRYYILNKPVGYICSTRGRKSVLSLFQGESYRLFTVGRLDKDTSGLLIVTNDGHFAHQVIHPSSGISKEYLAKTTQEITDEHLKIIFEGLTIEGVFIRPLSVKKVRKGTLKVTLVEGKKREVRILLENAGLTVQQLMRIRIGGLRLGSLPLGSWRAMTEREKTVLFEEKIS